MDGYREWEQAVNCGALVHDNLSLTAFQTNVELGLQNAKEYCALSPNLFFSANDIEYLHSLIFKNALNSPGRYQEDTTEPWYDRVRDVFDPDEPENTPQRQEHYTKMEKLKLEAEQMYRAGLDTEQKCSVLAFYHAALVILDPFTIGAGRVAQTITGAQVEKLFGKDMELSVEGEAYKSAIKDVQLGKGLEGLSSLIRGGIRPKNQIEASLDKQIERVGRFVEF